MATYVPSLANPASFEVPQFEAPSEFLFQVQRQKQAEFNKGLQEVGQKYNAMGNLGVSSQIGLAKRDTYMQQASEQLRKIAGADFSLSENVSAANSIYKPMTTDPDILTDLYKTNQANSQASFIEKLKNSKDDKERSQYWDTGAADVYNSIKKLREAKTSEELNNTEVRNYVPYVDIIGKLNNAAEKMHLKVVKDSLKGEFKITQENGQDAKLPFYIFAQSQLGQQEREVLKVMGRVQADQDIANETYRLGDEATARTSLASSAMRDQFDEYTAQIKENNQAVEDLKALLQKEPITDVNHDQMLDYQKRIDLITAKTKEVEGAIRDMGYDKVQDNYVQNANYARTLNSYSRDLWIPYMLTASKNITRLWATGLASSTASYKLSMDDVWAKGIDLKIQEAKLQTEAASAGTKATKGTTEEAPKTATSDINTPVPLGLNPYGQQTVDKYEYYQSQRKQLGDALYDQGASFVHDALPELGLSADFLTAFNDQLKNGASTEAIGGASQYSLAQKFPKDVERIKQAIIEGKIETPDGSMSFGDVFKGLMLAGKNSIKKIIDNAGSDDANASASAPLYQKYKVLNRLMEAYNVFKDDDAKIKSQILQGGEFNDIADEHSKVLSKAEYLKRKTGYASRDELLQHLAEMQSAEDAAMDHSNFPGSIRVSNSVSRWMQNVVQNVVGSVIPIPVAASNQEMAQRMFDKLESDYDKTKVKFDEKFKSFISTGQSSFINATLGKDGKTAFTFPTYELLLRKDDDKVGKENADLALHQAFSEDNLTDVTKILNLDNLGSFSKVKQILNVFRNEVTDMKPEDGKVYFNQIGSDGKSSSITFFPTEAFIKQFQAKGNPFPQGVLEKIQQYGVELSADNVTNIERQKPSIVSRLIDINQGEPYEIAPELNEKGFGGKIIKRPNGEGYDLKMSYKMYDANGKEISFKNAPPQGMSAPFMTSRLDDAVSGLYSELLNAYFNYSKQKKALEPKPSMIYSLEQLQQEARSSQN